MKTTYSTFYMGVVIFRNTSPGFALRYYARTPSGLPVAADTLRGIKSLIKSSL